MTSMILGFLLGCVFRETDIDQRWAFDRRTVTTAERPPFVPVYSYLSRAFSGPLPG